MAEIVLGPAQKRVMRTVRVQRRLKSVKIRHVPTHYPAKSGNVADPNQ
jgi:hypothetical protein